MRSAPMVATLVAGPANRNTSTAPGDTPAASNAVAMGVDSVAQTYSGTLIASSNNMAGKPLPYAASALGGTNVSVTPAISSPIASQGANSANIWVMA